MTEPVAWLVEISTRLGLRYEAEPDERWLRVWEPYVTLRTPIRYEHALSSTGDTTALTIARFVLPPREGFAVGDESWIAIGQDERMKGARIAATNDPNPTFRDTDVTLPRRMVGDAAWDETFSTHAKTDAELVVLNSSLRKLVLGWRAPVHFEIRQGGYVLAPTALRPDAASLAWLLDAVRLFSSKAGLN
jgi:hypothetical protein